MRMPADKLLVVHVAEQRGHVVALHAAAFDLHEDFLRTRSCSGERGRLVCAGERPRSTVADDSARRRNLHARRVCSPNVIVKISIPSTPRSAPLPSPSVRGRASISDKRPLLELPLVQFRQGLRALEIGGLAAFLKLDVIAESVFEPAFDEIDGEVSDINANPLPAELLRRVNGGAATAKRIQHESPLLLLAAIMRSSKATGFCVG